MKPKELEGNKTYTVLTAVLGEQFWELASEWDYLPHYSIFRGSSP